MNKIKTITCKKDLLDESLVPVNFIKGVQYNFSIGDNINYGIFVFNENSYSLGQRFHLNKNGCVDPKFNINYPNFYDYFYSEQEIRKLKLDKLKSIENEQIDINS